MNLIPFVALVKKDLLLFFKDRRSVMMSFAAPIAIASFFGLVLGGALSKDDRQRIPVWFVDEDRSALTTKVGQRLQSEPALEVRTGAVSVARERSLAYAWLNSTSASRLPTARAWAMPRGVSAVSAWPQKSSSILPYVSPCRMR